MRAADFADLLKGIAVDVREFIAQALAPITAKQAELEARIAAIPTEKATAEPGPPGASAYDIACAAGFTGSEQEWLVSLRGRDGESGERGEVGEVPIEVIGSMLRDEVARQVAELPPAQDGKSVTPDDVRPMVQQLVDLAAQAIPKPATPDDVRQLVKQAIDDMPQPADGKSITVDDVQPLIADLVAKAAAAIPVPADGKAGTNGKDGASVTLDDVRPLIDQAVAAIPKPKDGENVPIEVVAALVGGEVAKAVAALPAPHDGRDAALIEPLPAIDPTRSYPRGTWAKHQRGLWLARATTDGMTGWDCIVAGVAALEMTSDGMRSITVKSILSDGSAEQFAVTLPTMAYRGAWAPGEYTAGDTASWDGSIWHCEETTTDRPGSSAAWRLCVKRGRDGKDGVRGPKGERGSEGRPGRDLTQLALNGNRS